MIVKGIVSAIDVEANTVDVILPEYGGIVTRPTKLYGMQTVRHLNVNEFVMVVVFNNDFNDCMILMPFTSAQ